VFSELDWLQMSSTNACSMHVAGRHYTCVEGANSLGAGRERTGTRSRLQREMSQAGDGCLGGKAASSGSAVSQHHEPWHKQKGRSRWMGEGGGGAQRRRRQTRRRSRLTRVAGAGAVACDQRQAEALSGQWQWQAAQCR